MRQIAPCAFALLLVAACTEDDLMWLAGYERSTSSSKSTGLPLPRGAAGLKSRSIEQRGGMSCHVEDGDYATFEASKSDADAWLNRTFPAAKTQLPLVTPRQTVDFWPAGRTLDAVRTTVGGVDVTAWLDEAGGRTRVYLFRAGCTSP